MNALFSNFDPGDMGLMAGPEPGMVRSLHSQDGALFQVSPAVDAGDDDTGYDYWSAN